MPESDEVTPHLEPRLVKSPRDLSPLQLPTKRALNEDAGSFCLFNGPLSPQVVAGARIIASFSEARRVAKRVRVEELPRRQMTEEEEDVRLLARALSPPRRGTHHAHALPLAQRMSKRVRSSRCGTCANCVKPDCGLCQNCKDKPKFGGSGVKKQACRERACLCPNRALNFQDEED